MFKSGKFYHTYKLERYNLGVFGWNTRGTISHWIEWVTRDRPNKALHVLITYLTTSALCNVDVCGTKPDILVAGCDILVREILGMRVVGGDAGVGLEVIKGLVR
jgi:hypothetical protein